MGDCPFRHGFGNTHPGPRFALALAHECSPSKEWNVCAVCCFEQSPFHSIQDWRNLALRRAASATDMMPAKAWWMVT